MVVRGGEERKSRASPIYGRGVEHAWGELQQPRARVGVRRVGSGFSALNLRRWTLSWYVVSR